MKSSFILCIVIVFSSCLNRQTAQKENAINSSEETKSKKEENEFTFSFSKTGYTNDIIDKFHHIQIVSEVDIDKSNLAKVNEAILKTNESRHIIDSLEKEIQKLDLIDSVKIGFIDNHMSKCQVHGGDCLFRYYRFEKNQKGDKLRFDAIRKDRVFINNLPLSNYPVDSLLKYFGEPDSVVVRERFGIGEGMHQSYYYGSSFFSADEGDSLYYLESIDLREQNFEIEIDGHFFNSNSTMHDIMEVFPLSYLNMEFDSYKNGKYDLRMRILNTTNGQIEDTSLLIEFIGVKISRFVYFIEWV